MKLRLFLIGTALCLLLAAIPAEARPSPVCVTLKGPTTCPGIVCADENLDGRFQWDECIIMYCPMTPGYGCCGGPCPPPMEANVDTSQTCTGYMNVGGVKQRSCVDADRAPECGAWSEGWHPVLGYFKTCYGTP